MWPKVLFYRYFMLSSRFLTREFSELVRNSIEANKNKEPEDCNNITMQQNIAEAISTCTESTDVCLIVPLTNEHLFFPLIPSLQPLHVVLSHELHKF